ncbi:MAG: 4-alpha-glucanotransferase, partial [Ferruginibacter sp.]
MLIEFFIRFSTRYGQSLSVSGNAEALGNGDTEKTFPLQYFNNEYWHGSVEVAHHKEQDELTYQYILHEENGDRVFEWGNDRIIFLKENNAATLTCCDTWNHAGEIENAFYTKAFQEILLARKNASKKAGLKKYSHEFRVKAPLLKPDEVICICGPANTSSGWSPNEPAMMQLNCNWFTVRIDLAAENFPVNYRYAVYNTKEKKITQFENGNSRTLHTDASANRIVLVHDGFAFLPNSTWKAAGVAIPVFSLKSKNSFGTGEFSDIKLLVDWAKATGLKMIQLLPLNDTTATHSIADSYPYAAISAFALHPLYLNLNLIAGKEHAPIIKALAKKQKQLNLAPELDYGQVMKFKLNAIKELFEVQKEIFKNDPAYFLFFEMNRHWLVPYAAFCFLRDKYATPDFTKWKSNSSYDENAVQKLVSPSQNHYDEIALHYFMQYHLHLQLKDATSYAHKNGIVVKGDIPIGVYRYGCDAWTDPDLYHMEAQAGAPPDDFAVKGQNWGFPTYNWKKMQEDGFAWWRKRFEQMSEYFDAFRIDHILGFFRIWSIPLNAVEGIMGKFVPAIPVHINELYQQAISFQHHRYCKPYIPDHVVNERFSVEAPYVKDHFLFWNDGTFQLKPDFDTQRKVEHYFSRLPDSPQNHLIKYGLFDMISNVIFFEEEGSQMQQYHFRINMEQTSSFHDLDEHSKQRLKQLYINY